MILFIILWCLCSSRATLAEKVMMTNLDYVKETQEALGVSNDRMANILGISNKKYLRYLMGNLYVINT